ncbi:hypothetical protein D3C86_1837000 [compost metagenome]
MLVDVLLEFPDGGVRICLSRWHGVSSFVMREISFEWVMTEIAGVFQQGKARPALLTRGLEVLGFQGKSKLGSWNETAGMSYR